MVYESIILGMWICTGITIHGSQAAGDYGSITLLVATVVVSIFLRYPEVVVEVPVKVLQF